MFLLENQRHCALNTWNVTNLEEKSFDEEIQIWIFCHIWHILPSFVLGGSWCIYLMFYYLEDDIIFFDKWKCLKKKKKKSSSPAQGLGLHNCSELQDFQLPVV